MYLLIVAPRREMKEKRVLMAAFGEADGDNSGYVGKAEFGQLLRYVVFFFRLWLLFAEMDTGGDGRITMEEFRRGLIVLELDFHPEPDVNEAYTQQEWHQLDPEGDGLILFDRFCEFALRWQLVEDFEEQTAVGGGTGKLRERPPLDRKFLDGPGGGTDEFEAPDSWRTEASDMFDMIPGRADADITALSLAFYERAVAAGTVAPVGDDNVSEMQSRRSWDGASSLRGQEYPNHRSSSAGESMQAEQEEVKQSVGYSYSGRKSLPGASGGSSLVEGGRSYWSRAISHERGTAASSAANREAAATSTASGPRQRTFSTHESVPNYSESCSCNGLSVKIGMSAHMTSSKGLPISVVRTTCA